MERVEVAGGTRGSDERWTKGDEGGEEGCER